jgi:hypothetical protein
MRRREFIGLSRGVASSAVARCPRADNDNDLRDHVPPTRAQTIAVAVWVVTLVFLGYWLIDHVVASVAKMPFAGSE